MAAPALDNRKAIAGLHLWNGKRFGEALRLAGYSKWTARAPKSLHAGECMAEAAKLDPEATPANLLALTRSVFRSKLNDAEAVKSVRIGEIARALDVTERSYGAGQPLDAMGESTSAPERLAAAARLVDEARRRGLIPPPPTGSVIDVTPSETSMVITSTDTE